MDEWLPPDDTLFLECLYEFIVEQGIPTNKSVTRTRGFIQVKIAGDLIYKVFIHSTRVKVNYFAPGAHVCKESPRIFDINEPDSFQKIYDCVLNPIEV